MKLIPSLLRLLNLRILIAIAAVGLLSLSGASAALATSDTGTQNPDLTVSVSLSPDKATVGDRVTATQSVTNNTGQRQVVTITSTLEDPNETYTSSTWKVTLKPWQTATWTATYTVYETVYEFYPKGTYNLTISATNRNGISSSATASIIIE